MHSFTGLRGRDSGQWGGGGGCFTYTYYRGALWHITTVCMYLSCPPPTAAYTHAQQLSTTYLCTWATASHIHITHTPRAWNAYCTYVYIHNVCIRMYVCMYVCLYVCMYVSIGPAFFPASLACARPTLARGLCLHKYLSIYLCTHNTQQECGPIKQYPQPTVCVCICHIHIYNYKVCGLRLPRSPPNHRRCDCWCGGTRGWLLVYIVI